MWGDGKQTRSYLYVDECLEGVRRLMKSKVTGPVNIGSEEMVSINTLADMVSKIADKKVKIKHIKGPLGVRGRSSDNKRIWKELKWKPTSKLVDGLTKTYSWIDEQVKKNHKDK
jgi:nucleoside-diphosphate-sugar epimerase